MKSCLCSGGMLLCLLPTALLDSCFFSSISRAVSTADKVLDSLFSFPHASLCVDEVQEMLLPKPLKVECQLKTALCLKCVKLFFCLPSSFYPPSD